MTARSERREQTRQQIVDAAFAIVAERGYAAASVNEIASAAGFSVGALYGNFAGKDELFLAVYDAHAAWFEETLAAVDVAAEPLAFAEEAFARLEASREQLLVFVDFWAYAVRDPQLRGPLAERMASLRAVVAARLEERARTTGRPLAAPAATLATLLLATWRGLALEWLADEDSVSREDLARLLAVALG